MNKAPVIRVANSAKEITACYPVMVELRPHLTEGAFLDTIKRLKQTEGYQIAFLDDGTVKAVTGYRIGEWLHSGRYLEIEELVTAPTNRSKGYGGLLFDWLCAEARRQGCQQIRLVSGVARENAHRFYERKGMTFEAHYYSLNIERND